MVALIVVLTLVIYGITQQLYMMSIVVFLFAGVYMLRENNIDPVMEVTVTEQGIQVHNSFYEYSKIANFAILYDGVTAVLLRLNMKKWIAAIIDIPLTQDVNPTELKNTLLTYIEENTNAELSSSDKIIQAMRL